MMAVADNAGVDSITIGLMNMGMGMGLSGPMSRNYAPDQASPQDQHLQQQQQQHFQKQQQQHRLQLQLQHHQQLQQQQQALHQHQQQVVQHHQQQQHQQQQHQLHLQQQQQQQHSQPKQVASLASQKQLPPRANGVVNHANDDSAGLDAHSTVSNDRMRELEDLLTTLNPLAKEFVPPSSQSSDAGPAAVAASASKGHSRRKNGYNLGKRRVNSRTSRAQREDSIRRTVYVSDIDQQVTEEKLAALFVTCGQVVDCRVCGDPNSVLRFAFVEFTDEDGARAALGLAGTMLGYYPVRVLPSKTAIVPVNPTFLPRSEDEREMCARTIYCTNIDKKVSQADVKLFFESLCGEVARLRLLGDFHHSTRIAFVEFVMAESAMNALNCSGAILGSLPIRVSPSKTPVRPRSPRPPPH